VFLSLATAALLSEEVEDLDPAPIEHARILVERAYSPPESDVQRIDTVERRVIEKRNAPETVEATERGGTAAADVLHVGEATLSFQALEIAGTGPQDMPAFKSVGHIDQSAWDDIMNFDWVLASSIFFGNAWVSAKEEFLDIAFTG